MRFHLPIAVLLLLTASATGAEPAAVAVARQVIARENARLADEVEQTKNFMARARLTPQAAAAYQHKMARMESAVALHNLLLKQGEAIAQAGRRETLIAQAKTIVHADLERHYQEQIKAQQAGAAGTKQARENEYQLLEELKALEE